jgi:hypothetical protein
MNQTVNGRLFNKVLRTAHCVAFVNGLTQSRLHALEVGQGTSLSHETKKPLRAGGKNTVFTNIPGNMLRSAVANVAVRLRKCADSAGAQGKMPPSPSSYKIIVQPRADISEKMRGLPIPCVMMR